MVNVFEFTNFRDYLIRYFKERKKRDPGFSHRWLCRQLELSTSNFIMLVMQGKRNLNTALCFKLSRVLKHTSKEAEYFENMVNFVQAKKAAEKDLYFSRMMSLRKKLKIDRIDEKQYEYYSKWYNPVIRELVTDPETGDDEKKLAATLRPRITAAQAKKSVELLKKLGLIKKSGNKYVQSSRYIETDPEVNSLAVINFHRSMGKMAVESLDRFTKKQRNVTSSTVLLNSEAYEKICRRISDFRREILELAGQGDGQGSVYQVNFQIFPLSKECGADNKNRGGRK